MAGRAAGTRKKLDAQLLPTPFIAGMPDTPLHSSRSPPLTFSSSASGWPPYVPPKPHSQWTATYEDVGPNALHIWQTSPVAAAESASFPDPRRSSFSDGIPPYPSPPPSEPTQYLPTPTSSPLSSQATLGLTYGPSSSTIASIPTISDAANPDPKVFRPWMADEYTHPAPARAYHSPPSSPPLAPVRLPQVAGHRAEHQLSPSQPQLAPQRPRLLTTTPSTQSHSSSSEEDFAFLGQDPKPAPAFVYPSARTRARPGRKPTPGLKLSGSGSSKGKRKESTEGGAMLSPTAPAGDSVSPSKPKSPSSRASSSGMSTLTYSSGSTSASSGETPAQAVRRRAISASASKTNATRPDSQTFYFPSARTRAHPKVPGLRFGKDKVKDKEKEMGKKQGKGKEKEGAPDSGSKGFLGLGLRKKGVGSSSPASATSISPILSPSMVSAERSEYLFPGGTATSEKRSTDSSRSATPTSPSSIGVGYNRREAMVPESYYHHLDVPPAPAYVSKVGVYPLDSYDPILMDADRQTWELIRKLDRTHGGPTFHDYGVAPPRSALDLGCGAGHWLVDAAGAWRKAGTQLVGVDLLDTMRGTWATLQRQGLAENVKFVRANFVRDSLPFPTGSFELVRMANLSLCIPRAKWEFVLDEARRVLCVGGRLELIDDHVFFPYGKPLAAEDPPVDQLGVSDSDTSNSERAQAPICDDRDSVVYDIYSEGQDNDSPEADVEADEDADIMTLYADDASSFEFPPSWNPAPPTPSTPVYTSAAWHAQADGARDLEALFENMLGYKFGIHPRPSEFVVDLLMRVFGGVKEMSAMHLTLAPPPPEHEDVLAQSPGLILWPSTFVPMTPAELEAAVSKHQRVLLSCKGALVEYAGEVAEEGEGEEQREAAGEALWEYQNFLHERFNHPLDESEPIPVELIVEDEEDEEESLVEEDETADGVSLYSEALHDLEEVQSELQQQYDWTPEGASTTQAIARPPASTPRGPPPPLLLSPPPPPHSPPAFSASPPSPGPRSAPLPPHLVLPPAPLSAPPQPPEVKRVRPPLPLSPVLPLAVPRPRPRASTISSGHTTATRASAPPYSRVELTHVRTFYVYAAVKEADGRFSAFPSFRRP
ncbi:Methyltransf-25 domain-containing protein [Mycena kentingensis (nom. inval.)]|nr:Methyltransf-25 domain-containing protein [Mycena kentingensis (nom. inval.)]